MVLYFKNHNIKRWTLWKPLNMAQQLIEDVKNENNIIIQLLRSKLRFLKVILASGILCTLRKVTKYL